MNKTRQALQYALDELKEWNPESEAVKEIEDVLHFADNDEIGWARQTLKDAGYQTENLWHIDDVMQTYECDEQTAMIILERALQNEATMEQIFMAIDWKAELEGLELRDRL